MRKLAVLAIIISLVFVGQIYAASQEAINPEAEPYVAYWKRSGGSILAQSPETILYLSPTVRLALSPTGYFNFVSPGDYDKRVAFITYSETTDGSNLMNETITVQISPDNNPDGTTWQNAGFYDYVGGATLQTSENISTAGSYYLWTDPNVPSAYVRLKFSATNTSAGNTISNTITSAQKY
jgi:hypothetical protein